MIEIPDNGAEGLGLSLTIYVVAITVTFLIIATPIYFAVQPARLENPGLAAYKAPPGTLLVPVLGPKTDFVVDWSDREKFARKIAQR